MPCTHGVLDRNHFKPTKANGDILFEFHKSYEILGDFNNNKWMSYNTLERLGNLLRSLKGIWWFPFLFNIHNKYIRFRPTNSSVAILRVLFSMDLHITGIQLRYHCPRCLGTFPWWEEGYFIFIYHFTPYICQKVKNALFILYVTENS